MIITMDMLENMLAEASSNLDTLVHLSPDRADAATTAMSKNLPSTASPAQCRSNISTPSPPPCDDFDDPRLSAATTVTKAASQLEKSLRTSNVSASVDVDVDVDVDDDVKVSTSPLFSLESNPLQLPESEMLGTAELSQGNAINVCDIVVVLFIHVMFRFSDRSGTSIKGLVIL